MALALNRIVWLRRRLSRMSPGEVPYRIAMLCRIFFHRLGVLGAHPLPQAAQNARDGQSWVEAPAGLPGRDRLLQAADELLAGHLGVFGRRVPMTGGLPDWNRDPVTGAEIPMKFGHSIDFRHLSGGVDIKFLWEVNRHLWWVTVAQAYAVSGEARYLGHLGRLIESWLLQCRYPLGPNWSSPVEHGIRLINWSIIWQLIGGRNSTLFEGESGQRLLTQWLDGIYKHIRFASDNYSRFSSADNHLIGEAAGVYVAASTWNYWEEVRALRPQAKEILEEEIRRQFAPDGVNLEQAFCYQKFSMEFLLASGLCAIHNGDEFSPDFWRRLEAAFLFVAAMTTCAGDGAAYGDSDEGRVFQFGPTGNHGSGKFLIHAGSRLFDHPALGGKSSALGRDHGEDRQSDWLRRSRIPGVAEPSASTQLPASFEQGGYILLGDRLHRDDELRLLFDVGPLGYNRVAGHGHADALAIVIWCCGREILIDPGTYAYNSTPEWRRYFRGTRAHNTLLVDGQDQSIYGGSFLWLRDVNTTLRSSNDDGDTIEVVASHDGYGRLGDPVAHVRRVRLVRSARGIIVQDWLECREIHDVTLSWHFAPECAVYNSGAAVSIRHGDLRFDMELPEGGQGCHVAKGATHPPLGWTSRRFYNRVESPTVVQHLRAAPEQVLETRLTLAGGPR